VLREAAPFECCAICGPGHAALLNIAHRRGPLPAEAIRLLQAHWQRTKGVPDFGLMLKDTARRAVAKRSPESRTASAKKAWKTMRQRQQ
jgi:hypothetical protein